MLPQGRVADNNNDNHVHDGKYKARVGQQHSKAQTGATLSDRAARLERFKQIFSKLITNGGVIKDRRNTVSCCWHVHKTCMQQREGNVWRAIMWSSHESEESPLPPSLSTLCCNYIQIRNQRFKLNKVSITDLHAVSRSH